MDDYGRILRAEQEQARRLYSYEHLTPPVNTRDSNIATVNPDDYETEPSGTRGDAQVVQSAPKTRAVKRYIIVDASQRDWVKQPNPYSTLTFTFGSQAAVSSNPPVYTNSTFIPTFAVEQSNLPQPIPGLPNLTGWTLQSTPSNIFYPPYNSSAPRGNFIGYDTGFRIQPSGSGFGSTLTPCNVSSLRLIRAVLPQRQFLQIPIVPGDADSEAIQSNLVGKPYSTFTTYPYLLFSLNEFFGQYVGGNEPIRRSFSVMTQKQRQQTNFETSVGVQQYDYEPWGAETLQLQSPITNLQRFAMSVTDPVGTPFVQNDNLSLSLIQATENGMFLKCFTGSYQYFNSNELRVGDRIRLYPDTLSNLIQSPLLAYLPAQKKDFIQALLTTNNFPVLQLLDYIPDAAGVYVPRDVSGSARTTPYVSSYNGFLIPNFVSIDATGSANVQYPGAIDSGTFNVLEPSVLISSNIPFLNVTLQPVYTLEMETLEPDTTNIGGTIVL